MGAPHFAHPAHPLRPLLFVAFVEASYSKSYSEIRAFKEKEFLPEFMWKMLMCAVISVQYYTQDRNLVSLRCIKMQTQKVFTLLLILLQR